MEAVNHTIETNQFSKSITENADRILNKKGVGVVGFSPGNTKFTLEHIRDTLYFAAERFSKVYIVIPDLPSAHTFKAIGASKPDKVSKWEGNRIKKVVKQVLQTMESKHSSTIEILNWEILSKSSCFKKSNEELTLLYHSNSEFHEDIIKGTIPVLKHLALVHKRNPEDIDAEEGGLYTVEEIAGLSAVPEFVNIDDFCVVYYSRWLVFDKYVEGVYDKHKKKIGWLVCEEQHNDN